MNGFNINDVSEKCKDLEDVYLAEDGLLHCTKCRDNRQTRIKLPISGEVTVYCLCRCRMNEERLKDEYYRSRNNRKKEPPNEEILDYDF